MIFVPRKGVDIYVVKALMVWINGGRQVEIEIQRWIASIGPSRETSWLSGGVALARAGGDVGDGPLQRDHPRP